MFKKYNDKLFCFSPPVMLATLVIEFCLAAYTFIKYKMTTISRLAIAILITLGIFQLSEYMICGGFGLTHAEWTKFGYIATALLPAFGIHLIVAIAQKKSPLIVGLAYASSILFIAYYSLNSASISGQECYANYAVFYATGLMSQLFAVYYFGWLSVGGYIAVHWSRQLPEKRIALHSVVIGGLLFIIPTYFFNVIDPTTTKGIPSIMCGFAVIFALILALRVLPNSCQNRKTIK